MYNYPQTKLVRFLVNEMSDLGWQRVRKLTWRWLVWLSGLLEHSSLNCIWIGIHCTLAVWFYLWLVPIEVLWSTRFAQRWRLEVFINRFLDLRFEASVWQEIKCFLAVFRNLVFGRSKRFQRVCNTAKHSATKTVFLKVQNSRESVF